VIIHRWRRWIGSPFVNRPVLDNCEARTHTLPKLNPECSGGSGGLGGLGGPDRGDDPACGDDPDASANSANSQTTDISLGIVEVDRMHPRVGRLGRLDTDFYPQKENTMSNSSTGKGYAGGRRGGFGNFGDNWPGSAVMDAMNQFRGQFESGRSGMRMGRGDVRAAVMALLAEKPMHGYQIIQEISERSGGVWKPSPGSVYPTLQLLTDEGLISVEESNGRKTYSLTDEGRAVADAADHPAPWDTESVRDGMRGTALPKAGIELAQAAAQVGRSGTPAQVTEAVAVLDEARRKLYAILAKD
jgi:DNA-binding PadR family transcriptional regulator